MRTEDFLGAVSNFLDDRPVMKEANARPDTLGMLTCQESQEAAAEYAKGDYEALKYEIVDIVFFSMAMLHIAGISAEEFEEAWELKVARNLAKYPAHLFQEGDYDTIYQSCRDLWKQADGDKYFLAGES